MEEPKKRGGKREGSGRKKTVCKTYTFYAPADVAGVLEKIGRGKSQFICDAIRLKAGL